VALLAIVPAFSAAPAEAGAAKVWHVCNGNAPGGCPKGRDVDTIKKALDKAHAGDWILVWPGDYHENGNSDVDHSAGVWITIPNIHLRGMDRNLVVVDGTKPNPHGPCSNLPADQDLGPPDPGNSNQPAGRDGIVAWKVDGTYIENLTTCNFLTGSGGHGNEIWWNGGDGSGTIGMHTYWGNFLTATSTFSNKGKNPRGEYGIFVSNAGNGPNGAASASINDSYASNMGDAAFYVGACPNCNATLNRDWGEYSSLGYSGTNSGGNFLIENTTFSNNKTGLTANSQNNDDQPSPQSGACPDGSTSALGAGHSCTVFMHNSIHDNNNVEVPGVGEGLSGGAPVGTGIVLAGTRFITLYQNQVENNNAWGILVTDEPDQETAPQGFPNCNGGFADPSGICWYQAWGNETWGNTLRHNGGYGNPTNGDLALIGPLPPPIGDPSKPNNCFHGNVNPDRENGWPKSDPPPFPASETSNNVIQSPPYSTCGTPSGQAGNQDPVLIGEAGCNTELLAPCPASFPFVASYPRSDPDKIVLTMPARSKTPTMPDPCAGVPRPDPWCPYGGPSSAAAAPVQTTGPSSAGTNAAQPAANPFTAGGGQAFAPIPAGMALAGGLIALLALIARRRMGRRGG
jgi:hypothetical protein